MRLGPRAPWPPVPLAASVLAATCLAGCGWFGDDPEVEAFDYLPADAQQVSYVDRAAMAERLGVDDIDPRDASEEDVDRYLEAIEDVGWGTELTVFAASAPEAQLNEFDIEWEATASGLGADGEGGAVTVWKVGDDFDADAFGAELEDLGYEQDETHGYRVYGTDLEGLDTDSGVIGDHYPVSMLNVLVDPDDDLVVSSTDPDSVAAVADVVSDDADSLADDGGFDEVLGAVDDDPEHFAVERGEQVCPGNPALSPEQVEKEYADLGHPEARALVVSGDDADVVFALQFPDGSAAEDDLAAREDLLADGLEPATLQSFSELGSFELERDGDLVTIRADLDAGPRAVGPLESNGGGPTFCLPE